MKVEWSSLSSCSFTPWKELPTLVQYEAVCAPEPVSTIWSRKKHLHLSKLKYNSSVVRPILQSLNRKRHLMPWFSVIISPVQSKFCGVQSVCVSWCCTDVLVTVCWRCGSSGCEQKSLRNRRPLGTTGRARNAGLVSDNTHPAITAGYSNTLLNCLSHTYHLQCT